MLEFTAYDMFSDQLFGHRDDDNTSLGDWTVYERKFPQGIKHFADYVHEQGLKFGLWFEPEMIPRTICSLINS